jgi:5'-3' exonuclease
MGIHKLWQTLAKLTPSAFQADGLGKLGGAHVFVDTPVFAYAALNALGTDAAAAQNVIGLAKRILRAGAASCTLVFDGPPHLLKMEELARRRARMEAAAAAAAVAADASDPYLSDGAGASFAQENSPSMLTDMLVTDLDETLALSHNPLYTSVLKQQRPTPYTFDAIRLAAIECASEGNLIVCINAPSDAEQECAIRARQTDGIACTSDSDTLTFGAPRILRYVPGDPNFSMVHLQEILDELGLSFSAFQQWCVMCGSDFCEPIRGVGPAKSLKFIREALQDGPEQASGDLIRRVFVKQAGAKLLKGESADAFSLRFAGALGVFCGLHV